MQISLRRITLLRFFKKIHKFALCEFMPYVLGNFISLLLFFGYFCPILLMQILANVSRTKSRIRQDRAKSLLGCSKNIYIFENLN